MEEGRGAILLRGAFFPGFNSIEEAMEAITYNPRFQAPGAVAVELGRDVKKKRTFRSDFRPPGTAKLRQSTA